MPTTHLLVTCEGCGIEYRSGFVVSDSQNVTFTNNASACPNCGRINPVENRTIHKV